MEETSIPLFVISSLQPVTPISTIKTYNRTSPLNFPSSPSLHILTDPSTIQEYEVCKKTFKNILKSKPPAQRSPCKKIIPISHHATPHKTETSCKTKLSPSQLLFENSQQYLKCNQLELEANPVKFPSNHIQYVIDEEYPAKSSPHRMKRISDFVTHLPH